MGTLREKKQHRIYYSSGSLHRHFSWCPTDLKTIFGQLSATLNEQMEITRFIKPSRGNVAMCYTKLSPEKLVLSYAKQDKTTQNAR